jgi:GntR family transcriptional regulator
MARTVNEGDANDGSGASLFRPSERFILDPESPVPLYYQLERVLVDRISKEDAVGRMFPAEKELMQIFGISRATVKKTLGSLVAKGLVQRRRALGTRVISQEITEDLTQLSSYTEEMEKKGLKVSTEVLGVGVAAPDEYVRKRLLLREGEEVLFMRRLRGTSAFFPVVLLKSHIPTSFGISCDEDFAGSLYRILENKYHIPIEWADEEIRAGAATIEEAQYLGLKPGATVLIMERLSYTRGNQPLEFVRAVYRPEHYKYSIRIKRTVSSKRS